MRIPKYAELRQGDNAWALKTEDWWALWVGLFLFVLGFVSLAGADLVGWMPAPATWVDLQQSIKAPSGAPLTLLMIGGWLFITALLTVAASFMERDTKKFVISFSVIYWITWACWLFPHHARLAATPLDYEKFGISSSAMLGSGAAYLVALAVGLLIGNVFRRQAAYLREAALPEMFIKIAIVLLGIKVGLLCFKATGMVGTIIGLTACSVVGAYLIIWPLSYLISRKLFKLGRDLSAVLSSGLSICGVSAAMATTGAIRAKAVYPVMVTGAIVIFAVAELVAFPFFGAHLFWDNPLVPADWFGLAIKTDGAEAAAGGLLEELVLAKAALNGVQYEPGWILATAVSSKIFIDLFIGVWAFVLAIVWVYWIRRRPGEVVPRAEIWYRFPKFVLGYFATFLILLGLSLSAPDTLGSMASSMGSLSGAYRHLFFMLTFVAIGINTDVRSLLHEHVGRVFGAYAFILFGIIIWIGLAIAFTFFNGFLPPIK
jgi:uncharacterized membrane protein YadS